MNEIDSYSEFASHVFGLLNAFGLITMLKFVLIMGLSIAGFFAFVRFLRGS